MLNGLLKKKKKADEPVNPQVSRDEVGARLKGFFKESEPETSEQATDNRSVLKRLVASAAAEALQEPEDDDGGDARKGQDAERVEEANAAIVAASQAIEVTRANRSPGGEGPAQAGPTFRDIGRDIQAHLATLRQSNAEIQAFLNEGKVSEVAVDEAGATDSYHQPVATPTSDAEGLGTSESEQAPSAEEPTVPDVPADDAEMTSAQDHADDAAVETPKELAHEEPASDGVKSEPSAHFDDEARSDESGGENPDEMASEPALADDAVSIADMPESESLDAPPIVPDVADIVDEADEMLGEESERIIDEEEGDALDEGARPPESHYGEKASLGDRIASMTPDEHHERLRRLEEMVTGGFETDPAVDVSADERPDSVEDAMDASVSSSEPAGADEDETRPADAVAEVEIGSVADGALRLPVPLMLSDEVMQQEDDTAAYELNAQICDFLLFDAYVTSEELSEPAFTGWSVDFFWRNAVEGGLARFAHLAIDRPEIWQALVGGLEAVDAESHLRVVEALQALLTRDAELSEALAADPAAGEGVEVFGELDSALVEADEEFSLPHAMGGWLKSQDGIEVLETEALRQKVSAYADLPELQARSETDENDPKA